MSKVLHMLIRNLVGICLVVGVLASSSSVRAQTAPTADALWAWGQDGALSVCLNPTTTTAIDTCFSGYSTFNSFNTPVNLIETDGTYVYAATNNQGWGYKCPIAGPGPNNSNCTKILVGPFNPNNYDSSVVGINAIVGGNGYIWTAQLDGTIWRCPDNIPWNNAIPSTTTDIAATGCVLLDTSGTPGSYSNYYYDYNFPQSLALVGDTLYVGLRNGAQKKGNQPGLLWTCPSMTANSCTTLDNPGQYAGVLSLAAGGGYLWAGLQNGIVWQCDLTKVNSCTNWDKAGQPIFLMAYDGQGNLGIGTGTYYQNGVLWSCPTATQNACKTWIGAYTAPFGIAAGNGSFFMSYVMSMDSYISFNGSTGTTYTSFSQYTASPNLLFIPAGGLTTLGSARVQVPFTGDAARFSKYCSKQGRRAMANVSVSGPYGMKVKRRVNLCKFYDANEVRSEIKFDALDHGQYRVTVQSRSFYGQADFVLNDNNVQDVSVTLTRRRK